jgi:hypothetical protein
MIETDKTDETGESGGRTIPATGREMSAELRSLADCGSSSSNAHMFTRSEMVALCELVGIETPPDDMIQHDIRNRLLRFVGQLEPWQSRVGHNGLLRNDDLHAMLVEVGYDE